MRIKSDRVYALLNGRTQASIAEEMGVFPKDICNWLNGTREPRYERMVHLAEVLDIPVKELALTLREISNERRK